MKISVNGKYEYEVQAGSEVYDVNGEPVKLDSKQVSASHTHVLYNNKSYNVQLISEDRALKTCTFKVNGNLYTTTVQDQYDQLLKQLGMESAFGNKIKDIKAPMPGLVLNILVYEGLEVSKGDNILVLEAMKMENIIKSPSNGKISKILVSPGGKVEKNQILVQFD